MIGYFCSIPAYWTNCQEAAKLCLMCCLLFMLCFEPIVHCMHMNTSNENRFPGNCAEGAELIFTYSVGSTIGMLQYFTLD